MEEANVPSWTLQNVLSGVPAKGTFWWRGGPMGPSVTHGMDELDLLILEAYPQANREYMDEYRALTQQVGFDRICSVLRKTADARKQEKRDREESVERARREHAARVSAAKAKMAREEGSRPRKALYLRPDMVPAPNCFVRSALFGIVKPGRRRRIEEYVVLPKYGANGWVIRWRGTRLDQADADVWLYLIRCASEVSGEFLNGEELDSKVIPVEFTRNGLLKAIKRSKGGRNRQWLDQALTRLRDFDIQVEDPTGTRRYSAKLLGDRYEDDNSDMEIVEVNTKLASLLGKDLSLINFQKRLELGQNQLAKWLHAFLGSHKGPDYSIFLSSLHSLAESPMPIRVFKQRVKEALRKISDVVESHDFMGKGEHVRIKMKLVPKKSR